MTQEIEDCTNTLTMPPFKRGRKALPDLPMPDREEAQRYAAAAAPALEELRHNSVTLHKGELAQSLALAQRLGSIKAFQLNESVNRVAMLRQFAEIRDDKKYKGLSVLDGEGQAKTINSWAEFCGLHGYSKSKIEEDLQNLAVFGGSLLEAQEALGLGYRELRRLRAGIKSLPPEEQQKILDEVQAVDGSEEAKAALDDLRIKLAETEIALKGAKDDMAAKEKLSKAKSERLDTLQEQIIKLTSLAPDEADAARKALNADACKKLDIACHQVMGRLNEVLGLATAMFSSDDMHKMSLAYVHKRVSMLCELMGQSILNVGIDVDFRTEFEVDYGPEQAAEEQSPTEGEA